MKRDAQIVPKIVRTVKGGVVRLGHKRLPDGI